MELGASPGHTGKFPVDLWKSVPVRVVQPWDIDQSMVCTSILEGFKTHQAKP